MKLYDIVIDLMQKYPKLRDSDKLLIWNVWGVSGFIKDGKISREDFLNAPHMESIRRVRQKIQETYPELQSSPEIQRVKKKKEKEKGTFVYREKTIKKEEVKKGHWDFSQERARFIED